MKLDQTILVPSSQSQKLPDYALHGVSQTSVFIDCDLKGIEFTPRETTAQIFDRLKNKARSLVKIGLQLTDMTSVESGWERITKTKSHENIKITGEKYNDGTNWGWNEREDISVKLPDRTIRLESNYPYGMESIRVNNSYISFSEENIKQIETILAEVEPILIRLQTVI